MRRTLLFIVAIIAFAGVANAQTNLGVRAGVLLPTGDFGDFADPSPYIGAHWELQDVNALGQIASLSFMIEGGFAFLQTDSDLETYLDSIGDSSDGSFFDLGVGARVHSTVSPLFVSVGASVMNVDYAGPTESKTGFGGHVGLGFGVDLGMFNIDLEGRANIGVLDGSDVQFFQVFMNLGLPF